MSAKTTLEVLKTARELISVPERWTKGAFARNYSKEECDPEDTMAMCWCVHGAFEKISLDCDENIADSIYLARRQYMKFIKCGVISFNDAPERTHSEILEVFDKAIADLTAQEQSQCSA